MKHLLLALALASLLAACSTPGGGTAATSLVPNKALNLTAQTSVSLANLAAGAVMIGAIYLVYDPLAPNWEIEEQRLGEDTYRMSLKMKRFHTGGAGESMQVFRRRASQLQYEQGFATYQVLDYSEGIESHTLGARRVAEGTVRLVHR